ncbi:unnamed protein product, partial [Mesorhabditis spiculigera]
MHCESEGFCQHCKAWVHVPMGERLPMVISGSCIFCSLNLTYYGKTDEEQQEDEWVETLAIFSRPHARYKTPLGEHRAAPELQVYQRKPTRVSIRAVLDKQKDKEAPVPQNQLIFQVDPGCQRGDEVQKCMEKDAEELMQKPTADWPLDLAHMLHRLMEKMTDKKYAVVVPARGITIGGENFVLGTLVTKLTLNVQHSDLKLMLVAIEVTQIQVTPQQERELEVEPTPYTNSYQSGRCRPPPGTTPAKLKPASQLRPMIAADLRTPNRTTTTIHTATTMQSMPTEFSAIQTPTARAALNKSKGHGKRSVTTITTNTAVQ